MVYISLSWYLYYLWKIIRRSDNWCKRG